MQKNYILTALTGSIGSGKSTAATFFSELGAVTIDADELAKEAVRPGSTASLQIRGKFGDSFFDSSGNLLRQKMAEHIFSSPELKSELESIIHPEVSKLLQQKLENIPADIRLVIYVVPLLFEAKSDISKFQKIISISSNKNNCLKRVLSRQGMSSELFEHIWNSQLSPEIKEEKADLVIKNDGTLEELKSKVREIFQQLIG